MIDRPRPALLQSPALWLGVLLLAGISLAFLAQYALRHGLAWPCVFLNITGVPCPTCGTTRALAALAALDPLSAFRLNPLTTAAVLAAIPLPFVWSRFRPLPHFFWIALCCLIMLNWLYLCLFLPR